MEPWLKLLRGLVRRARRLQDAACGRGIGGEGRCEIGLVVVELRLSRAGCGPMVARRVRVGVWCLIVVIQNNAL